MHMSDGIVNAPTSLLFAGIAIVGLGFAALKARTELTERAAPMAGLVAAFIFAVQMINFPILPGVSGHLLGGTLAAILVGPYVGVLCVAIVLVVQALLFADGGLTALGTNITNMALIGVAVGYTAARLLLPIVRRLPVVAFVAALLGTVCASAGFIVEYAIGGASGSTLGEVTWYMLGTHALIGIGEGIITAITVGAVAKARPDLVYLLRAEQVDSARSRTAFFAAFGVATLLCAGLLSYFASSQPDGLDATTQRGCTVTEVNGAEQLNGECIAQNAQDHHLAQSPLADYTIDGDNRFTGLAGVLGVLAAFVALATLVAGIRTRTPRP